MNRKLYTPEQFVQEILIPEYNEKFNTLFCRYDCDLNKEFLILSNFIDYMINNECLFNSMSLKALHTYFEKFRSYYL